MRDQDHALEHALDHDLVDDAPREHVDAGPAFVEELVQVEAVVEQAEMQATLDDREALRRDQLFELTRAILAGEDSAFSEFAELSRIDRLALEALATAISGRDLASTQLVFADDRRQLLELALAALQPALAHGAQLPDSKLARELVNMVDTVGELRVTLTNLSDAQDSEEFQIRKNLPAKPKPDDTNVDDDVDVNDDANVGVDSDGDGTLDVDVPPTTKKNSSTL